MVRCLFGTPATEEERFEFYNKIGGIAYYFTDGWYTMNEIYPSEVESIKCSYKFEISSILEYEKTEQYIKTFHGKKL